MIALPFLRLIACDPSVPLKGKVTEAPVYWKHRKSDGPRGLRRWRGADGDPRSARGDAVRIHGVAEVRIKALEPAEFCSVRRCWSEQNSLAK